VCKSFRNQEFFITFVAKIVKYMSKQRILIVDDEEDICMILAYSLQKAGYETLVAHSAEEALENFEANIRNGEIDLILLDIMMDQMSGLEMAERLRLSPNGLITSSPNALPPIIFLTALSDESTVLQGFQLGADDYVTKPFTMSVLYAKLSALINRRRGNIVAGDRLTAGDIVLHLSSRKVFVRGVEVVLTPKEYALLRCLMQNRNVVLSREQLLIKCWGYDYEGEARAVDTHIKRLREKLGDSASMIRTVIKSGYVLEV
jgi:DNA-binding response OmpR family regulator